MVGLFNWSLKPSHAKPVVVVNSVLLAEGTYGGQVGLGGAEATEAGQRRRVHLMDHLRKMLERKLPKRSTTISKIKPSLGVPLHRG